MNIQHSFKINRCLKRTRTTILPASMTLISGAFASDLAREKRMANEISEAILDGEPIWLNAGLIRFLGIATQALEQPAKGSDHPAWAGLSSRLGGSGQSIAGGPGRGLEYPESADAGAGCLWGRGVPERLAMMQKAGNPLSEQIVVPDADHYFHDCRAPLLEVVSDWLARVSGAKDWVK